MNLFGLIGIAVLWMAARAIGRVLRGTLPQTRRTASTVREQLARQLREATGVPSPEPSKPAPAQVKPKALDPVSAPVLDGGRPTWEQWVPLQDEAPAPVKQAPLVTPMTSRLKPVADRPGAARRPDGPQPTSLPTEALLPPLRGNDLIRGVILSEVLGRPKARRRRVRAS